MKRDATQITRMRTKLINRHRELRKTLGIEENIPKLPSALKVMYEVYDALSKVPRVELGGEAKGSYFQIKSVKITDRRADITIIAGDERTFDKVRRLFEQSKYFQDRARPGKQIVEPGAIQNVSGNRRKITYTFTFRED